MNDGKELVVLEEVERSQDRLVGYGKTVNGASVEFPVDEATLVGIVRMLTLSEGASVWVPKAELRPTSGLARIVAEPPRSRASLISDDGANKDGRQSRGRRVVVALPEPLVATLVGSALDASGYDVTLRSTADLAAGLDGLQPHAVVLDVAAEGAPNGVEIARALTRREPELGVVYLTRLPDSRFVGEEIPGSRRIAFLRLQETADPTRIVEAVEAVTMRRSSRTFRDDLRPDRPLGVLSNRQLWLLGQLARGLLLSDIAQARGVSERGAQRLLSRTYLRLGIRARHSGHARSIAVRRYCDAAGMAPVAIPDSSPG